MSETGAANRVVALVERSRPDIVRLAETVSLAVRIEPALLRRARQRLEPDLPVAAEADIWFSALVGSYSPRALLLRPEVAAVLRLRLRADAARCAAARELVEELHHDAPATIRLEEEVLYRALTGDEIEQVDVLLGEALTILEGEQERADAIARWAARALPSLPPAARDRAAARRLGAGAHRHLGRGEAVVVGVELVAGGIAVSDRPSAASHEVELPPGAPLELRVRPAGLERPESLIEVQHGATHAYRIDVPRRSAPGFDIETADGRVHELRPRSAAPRSAAVELADLQGDILRAYGNDYDHTTYAFVRIDCPAEQARAWLGGVAEHVTTAAPWKMVSGKPRTTLNIAVTATGLRALGVRAEVVGTFSREFRAGMASRARLLGDVGSSDPSGWESGLGTGDAHVLLTINAQEAADRERALSRMQAAIEEVGGIAIVFRQDTALLPGAREHFGFADGSSQPAIEGVSDDKAPGGGVPLAGGRWRALAPGEFVLGYPDEDTRDDPSRRLPAAPADPLGRSGTYMVWRKLHQDVALWRRVLRDAARHYDPDGDERRLAAKVVGRWRDGTPLVTHPDRPHPDYEAAPRGMNDFRYAGDPDGRRCPLGAHVRRANPRDALGFDGALSFRHRMIRRGMPYGPPLAPDATGGDGADRGLVFVSFQASISRQFEAVQVQWLNDGNVFGLGHDKDFLLGSPDGKGKMTIQGEPPFFLSPQEQFVRTRGGEYLFVPGIAALAAIADGTAG